MIYQCREAGKYHEPKHHGSFVSKLASLGKRIEAPKKMRLIYQDIIYTKTSFFSRNPRRKEVEFRGEWIMLFTETSHRLSRENVNRTFMNNYASISLCLSEILNSIWQLFVSFVIIGGQTIYSVFYFMRLTFVQFLYRLVKVRATMSGHLRR